MLFFQHQRWRQGDDVACRAYQHAVGESLLEGVEGARAGLAGDGIEFDAGDQADAAQVDHVRQAFQRVHGVAPIRLHRFGVTQDVLFLEHLQGCQRGGASERVAGIRVAVEQFDARWRIHEGVVDILFAEDGAHRHHAVGQALGRRHQVRLDVKIVGGERRRHAAETRDHFIEDEQDAVFGTQLAQAFQIAFRRDQHARGAGHRFDDDGGNRRCVMQGDDAFQFIGQVGAIFGFAHRVGVLVQVVRVRQVVHAWQQGAEGLAVAADAAHGNAAEAHAVITAFAADQARACALAAHAVIGQRDF